MRKGMGLRRWALVLLAVGVLPAPWFFGAWERWWFWPFAFFLFAAGTCLALHWLLRLKAGQSPAADTLEPEHVRRLLPVCLSFLPFLLYAAIRAACTPVYLDAERSLLLFLTAWLAGTIVAFGATKFEQRLLLGAIVFNLVALGVYGIANHVVHGSRSVMWAPQYPQYAGRATGSYHCPDHFSGIMELLFALGLAHVLSRTCGRGVRMAALAAVGLAAAGVLMSQSRGGGLTLLVVLGAAFVWGFDQWPPEARFWNRLSMGAAALIAVLLLARGDGAYARRFQSMVPTAEARQTPAASRLDALNAAWRDSPRGRMIPAAARSWRSAPVFGIGAGMHRNVWPAIAATPDADRDAGILPAQWNDTFHSYEVHSDWLQLAQEYGIVGLVLFLAPVWFVFCVPRGALARERLWWRRPHARTRSTRDHALVLGGLFCGIALAFHSLGDFNLQLPATTWLLAVLTGLALAAAARLEPPPARDRS